MASHKYRVGQVVDFNTSPPDVPTSMREYKILSLLPHVGGEQRYRIKTITEPIDRIVNESEITVGAGRYDRSRILRYCDRPELVVRLVSWSCGSVARICKLAMGFDQIANAMKTKNGEFRCSAKIDNDIHVERDESALWQVYRGDQRMSVVSFRSRGYAMAFARAVAFSRHVEMLVHEPDGRITRHKRASLTYPISLN